MTSGRPTADRPFRRDVGGLRGLAVLLVVAYHLTGRPVSGLVGVDVFFVLSGFLITGLLVRERTSTGRIDLVDFYRRRARRILPAAVLVTVVTAIASALVWFPTRALDVAQDAVASLTFAENWRLVRSGRDYLRPGGESPLQHFWSLGVEEQFYAFWPLLVIVLATVAARAGRGTSPSRWVLPSGVAIVVAVSLLAAAVLGDRSAAAAYFTTVGRVWELGAGALLALVPAARLVALGPRARTALSWSGLTLVVGAAVAPVADLGFPWPGALAPVAGTVLLLAAGSAPRDARVGPVVRALGWRPLRWVGAVSYSLYLWHMPVIVFGTALLGSGVAPTLAAVVVSFALAAATRRWVEVPFLRSRAPDRSRRRRERPSRRPVAAALVAGVVIAALGGSSWFQARTPGLDGAIGPARAAAVAERTDPVRVVSGATLDDGIRSALAARAWSPGVEHDLGAPAGVLRASAWGGPTGCLGQVERVVSVPRPCTWGPEDAERTVAVVGDSVAISWTPAVVDAVVPDGARVEALGFTACPVIDLPVESVAGTAWFPASCRAARAELHRFVRDLRPDVLVLSVATGYESTLVSGSAGRSAMLERAEAMERTLTDLTAVAPRIVVLEGPPRGESVPVCATRLTGPDRCITTIGAEYERDHAADRRGTRAVPGATFVPTTDWFCAPDGRCPAEILGELVTFDDIHLTERMARSLAGLVRAGIGEVAGLSPAGSAAVAGLSPAGSAAVAGLSPAASAAVAGLSPAGSARDGLG